MYRFELWWIIARNEPGQTVSTSFKWSVVQISAYMKCEAVSSTELVFCCVLACVACVALGLCVMVRRVSGAQLVQGIVRHTCIS